MTLSRRDCLQHMGIDLWHSRPAPMQPQTTLPDWSLLQQTVSRCTACPLHQSRTQTVFGTGSQHPRLMVIGEAPGYHEDQRGEPFVGRAGKLLDAMLGSIGLDRQSVYIANVLKCRPPANRDPVPAEVQQCTPFLTQQIALLQPTLLLAVGRIAAQYLLGTQQPLSQLRQTLHPYGNTSLPLIVTYHPAYLLRTPKDKGKALLDLQLVARTLEKSSPL